MSWDRTERTLLQVADALSRAETPEQCQAVGALARDALISLAQAVFRPELNWRSGNAVPSPTDSKRQLEAYVGFALAGGAHDEARSFAHSAIKLADALTHKRSATPRDARLTALATETVIQLIAICDEHQLGSGEEAWQGVHAGVRYFAWDGPLLHALEDRPPIPAPNTALEALQQAGHTPTFGTKERLRDHQARGVFQVFETDRNKWRRELLYDQDGSQVLLVKPKSVQ
jgi:hypothetical protein